MLDVFFVRFTEELFNLFAHFVFQATCEFFRRIFDELLLKVGLNNLLPNLPPHGFDVLLFHLAIVFIFHVFYQRPDGVDIVRLLPLRFWPQFPLPTPLRLTGSLCFWLRSSGWRRFGLWCSLFRTLINDALEVFLVGKRLWRRRWWFCHGDGRQFPLYLAASVVVVRLAPFISALMPSGG